MLEAVTLVTTLSTEQIVLEMVHAHVATGTDQSGLNGCCTATWKPSGKSITVLLF